MRGKEETGRKKEGPRNVSIPEALTDVAIGRESLPAGSVKLWMRSGNGSACLEAR
jgi:hypothetical protein